MLHVFIYVESKNKYNKTEADSTDAKNQLVIISEKWIGGKMGRELKKAWALRHTIDIC